MAKNMGVWMKYYVALSFYMLTQLHIELPFTFLFEYNYV